MVKYYVTLHALYKATGGKTLDIVKKSLLFAG